MKKIILLSGAFDSVTLLYVEQAEGHDLLGLSFDYGQTHVREIEMAADHCHRLGVAHEIIRLPPLGGLTDESWIVPNRNSIFIEHAVSVAFARGYEEILIGCNSDDYEVFPDCRQKFFYIKNLSIVAAGYNVRVRAPFINKAKWQIGGLAQTFKVSPDRTWSCYRGGEQPCGCCPACEKMKAILK